MSGLIPPIFASSLLVFPATIAQFFGNSPNPNPIQRALQKIAAILGYGQPLHVVLFAVLIIGFAFFYVALVYDARDTAENLKKAGAFIPGIRPGQQTGDYLDKVLTRLTLWGGLYIMAVCLLPELIRMANPAIPFQFGGTSLLIIVVGVMATTRFIFKIRTIGDVLAGVAILIAIGTGFAVAGVARRLKEDNNILQAEIKERKQAEEKLSWKTAFLEAQVNSTIDGILVVDE